MNSRFVATLVALLLPLLTGLQAASLPDPAEAYFRLRDHGSLVTGVRDDDLRNHAGMFPGKLVELRGRITGIAASNAQTTMVVETVQGLPGIAVALPRDSPLSTWPVLTVGAEIRALCRVIQEAGDPDGRLELVIPVSEADAARVDDERAQAVVRVRTTAASAAAGGAIESAYAGAVRRFAPQIQEDAARLLVRRLIRVSQEKGLDARLLLSVMAGEGDLDRVVLHGAAVWIGRTPAGDRLTAVARDLRRRLEVTGTAGALTSQAIRQALVARARGLAAGGTAGHAAAAAYSTRIGSLYRQLCGEVLAPAGEPDVRAFTHRWGRRPWERRSPERLVATWVGVARPDLAVFNRDGSGIFGESGGVPGRWFSSGPYLEFRDGGEAVYRGKWRVSDDGKSLLLTDFRPDGGPGTSTTFLRK